MSRLRVLLVGDYPPPQGGIAVHVAQLERELRARGHQVRVLDIGKGGGIARPDPDVLPARTPTALLRALWSFAQDGWLVHAHTSGNNFKSWLLLAALGAVAGGRTSLLATLHSGRLPAFLRTGGSRPWLARWALKRFDSVVAVSTPVRQVLESCGVARWRVTQLPAFLPSQVRPTQPPATFEPARKRRWPLIAFAHHPDPLYGREVLFRALHVLRAELPEAGAVLFGPGSDAPEAARAARAAQVDDRVHLLGELTNGEALAVIARSDVFVRPTFADGDSVSVREALALGVPCVASDASPRPRGVHLFRAGDPSALAVAIAGAYARGKGAPPAQEDPANTLLTLYRAALSPDRAASIHWLSGGLHASSP